MKVWIHTICFLLSAAVLCDYYSYQIPNELIILGYIMGLLYEVTERGWYGSVVFLIRALFPMILLYILFMIGGLGAGDLKLLSVISVFLTLSVTMNLIIMAFLIGGFVSVLQIIRRKHHLHFTFCICGGFAVMCMKGGAILG